MNTIRMNIMGTSRTTNTTRMFQAKSTLPSKNITTPMPLRIRTCTPNPKSANPNRTLRLHRISVTSTIPPRNIHRATTAAARHATIEADRTSAVAIKVVIAAETVAVGASGAVVGAVEVADDHPDRQAQPAAAICRRRNTPLRKAEISSAPLTPVVDTIHADSSHADSNLVVNSLAASTIDAPKAEVPVPLDPPT